MARTASLIYIVLDILKPLQHKRLIEKELEGFGIRLNQDPPNIYFKRKEKGGLNCQFLVPQDELDLDLIKTILSEYRIHNADIIVKYNATSDEFIDVVEGNRSYIPCIYLLNKIDQVCSLNSKYITRVKSSRIYTGQYTFPIVLLNGDNMLGEHK